MTLSLLFWIVWIVSLIFGGLGYWRAPAESRWYAGGSLLFYVLTGILGWAQFGPPIKGG